jgi:hypothetical protein
VRLAGPFLDNGGQMCGSFLIVEGSRSEVEAFAEEDPYRTAGLFRSSSIDEWVWAVSQFHNLQPHPDNLCTDLFLCFHPTQQDYHTNHHNADLGTTLQPPDVCSDGVQIHPPDASVSRSAAAGRMFSLLRCTDRPGSLAVRKVPTHTARPREVGGATGSGKP